MLAEHYLFHVKEVKPGSRLKFVHNKNGEGISTG